MKFLAKRAFSIVEIIFAVFVILIFIGIMAPSFINNSEKAKIVSNWKIIFEETSYLMKLFKIQNKEEISRVCTVAKVENTDVSDEMFLLLKPYLNIEPGVKNVVVSNYRYKFLNSRQVKPSSRYWTDNFVVVNNDLIVGFKWERCNCDAEIPCGYLLFDTNGTKPPNKFGVDIFGVNIFDKDIKAFGAGKDEYMLKRNCSKIKRGVFCSEYYLLGGNFY